MAYLERELTVGGHLLRFKGLYQKFSIDISEDGILLDCGYKIDSEDFRRWIAGCDSLYLFVVTAGPLFSERISELLAEERVSEAMIADAVGSAAGEACAKAANKYIAELENDNVLTKRYSPGYGDWNVSDNRNFLRHIEAGRINISVNEGGLMLPEKSVSAAIGVKTEMA